MSAPCSPTRWNCLANAEGDRGRAWPQCRPERDATDNVTEPTLAGFNLGASLDAADNRHQFTAMWYAPRTPRRMTMKEMPPPNLYPDHMMRCVSGTLIRPPTTTNMADRVWKDVAGCRRSTRTSTRSTEILARSHRGRRQCGQLRRWTTTRTSAPRMTGVRRPPAKGVDDNAPCATLGCRDRDFRYLPARAGLRLRSNEGGVHPHLRLEFPWQPGRTPSVVMPLGPIVIAARRHLEHRATS